MPRNQTSLHCCYEMFQPWSVYPCPLSDIFRYGIFANFLSHLWVIYPLNMVILHNKLLESPRIDPQLHAFHMHSRSLTMARLVDKTTTTTTTTNHGNSTTPVKKPCSTESLLVKNPYIFWWSPGLKKGSPVGVVVESLWRYGSWLKTNMGPVVHIAKACKQSYTLW